MPLRPSPDTLGVSRRVLRILITLNWLMGVLVLGLLTASLVAPEWVMRGLGLPPARDSARLALGMRLIMVLGIAAVPFAHIVLTRLLAIVHTVSVGDPFVSENADRLQTIAWAVLTLEVVHILIVVIATNLSTPAMQIDIRWNFSVARWLAVLLLFVLARVFEQGARMREDLEGTV